ncbi:MAG TPA: TlpA disulfide reductase family protein [Polyangiaceae bacterium]|nr:TlpA disulfide reductase family protein [Polyangiaceae bacterium]
MGRLPTLSCTLFLALPILSACNTVSEKDAPMATNERSQAITQKGPPALGTPATIAVKASEPAAAAKKPRSLCAGKLSEPGHALSKKHVSRAAAKGAQDLPEVLSSGGGKWTWLNFWAAWCAPCKEEIPRLLGFEQKLQASGAFRLTFVSLDDDERQLQEFLDSQPSAGLHRSYWLKEGSEREDWLKSAGQNPDAPLPFHLLVDPKGKIRCAIQGAVEDADFAEISGIVSAH